MVIYFFYRRACFIYNEDKCEHCMTTTSQGCPIIYSFLVGIKSKIEFHCLTLKWVKNWICRFKMFFSRKLSKVFEKTEVILSQTSSRAIVWLYSSSPVEWCDTFVKRSLNLVSASPGLFGLLYIATRYVATKAMNYIACTSFADRDTILFCFRCVCKYNTNSNTILLIISIQNVPRNDNWRGFNSFST